MVEQEYALPPRALRSAVRTKSYRQARGLVMLIIKRRLNMSYKAIGEVFNRDYSTVYSSIATVEDQIDKDSFLKERYYSLKNRLQIF